MHSCSLRSSVLLWPFCQSGPRPPLPGGGLKNAGCSSGGLFICAPLSKHKISTTIHCRFTRADCTWTHRLASSPFQLPGKASWQGGCSSSERRQQADSTGTIFHHFGHSNDPLTSCIFSLPRSWQAPSDNKAHVANCTFHNTFLRNEGLTQKLCYCNLLYWWSRNFRTRQTSPLIPYHI